MAAETIVEVVAIEEAAILVDVTVVDPAATIIVDVPAGGPPGPQGPAGPAGPTGPAGAPGAPGQGVPTGGSTGQVLTKTSATDYATNWQTPAAGGGGISDAPNDGSDYVRNSAAWVLFNYTALDGKPSTFPPTLPITQSGVTNLVSDQAAQDTAIAAKLPSASYTAADVLAKLLTVDGAGSGLDADLLDGNSSAFFATASSQAAQDTAIAAKLDSATAATTYAPLASPVFTGDPKAPTPATTDNDTSIATTAYVKAQAYVVGSGTAKITVSSSAPGSPATGDLWVDTT